MKKQPTDDAEAVMSKCSSCGARILWAVTESGKPMPVDPVPVPDGNLVLAIQTVTKARLTARVVEPLFDQAPFHKSHFATCPNADEHRKSR